MNVLTVFFVQMLELFLGALFWKGSSARSKKRHVHKVLSNRDKVIFLEQKRVSRGYKKAWLYHRCKEQGLLEEYNRLFKTEELQEKEPPLVTRFGFGKYKGEPVEEIWNRDRAYINWLLDNAVLEQHPAEEFAIDHLRLQ